jgi:hypothetical protein
MGSDEPPIQLPLTEEQQELLHRVTGEHAVVLELVPTRVTRPPEQRAGCPLVGESH